MSGGDATFIAFFDRHHAELARLAFLLTGDGPAADDLAADALARVRRDWPTIGADDPAAHARRLVAAATRPGRLPRARRATGPMDLRRALSRLPHRRRVCVVLRYASGLTEAEVAYALKISVGTVRSRTARGVRQVSALLGGSLAATPVGGPVRSYPEPPTWPVTPP
jgi:DNA-directed RNA polymerase specialized sigma24 family protein